MAQYFLPLCGQKAPTNSKRIGSGMNARGLKMSSNMPQINANWSWSHRTHYLQLTCPKKSAKKSVFFAQKMFWHTIIQCMSKENKDKDMLVRVQPTLFEKFKEKCEENYKSISEVIRDFMQQYLTTRNNCQHWKQNILGWKKWEANRCNTRLSVCKTHTTISSANANKKSKVRKAFLGSRSVMVNNPSRSSKTSICLKVD